MSIFKQINDRGAVLAWSPLDHMPPMLATATKEGGGGGFDEYGGELSIHSLDFSAPTLDCPVLNSVKTTSRFSSLAWGSVTAKQEKFPCGLIAAGMSDGIVNVWDANTLINGRPETALLSSSERHRASVKAVQFNPHPTATHLLAAASVDGDISIINLENPSAPTVASPLGGAGQRLDSEITSVAWNTSVTYILATATLAGTVVVWDLKENKAWCQLRDPHRASVSDVAWHPNDGLYLVTACDDDSRPVLRVWDLRSSTTTPLCELIGHTKGILSVDWCPHDPNLLVSCGKDSHTFVWDIQQGRAIAELPNPSNTGAIKPGGSQGGGPQVPHSGADSFSGGPSASSVFAAPQASSVFGGVPPAGFDAASSVFGGGMPIGGLAAGAGRRYCARWSHRNPGIVATCSFDRKIIVHAATALGPALAATTAAQVIGQGNAVDATMRRAPRWLRRPVGAAFGFGGRLVSFSCPVAVAKGDLRAGNAEYAKILQISVVNSDYELISKATAFESALTNIESTSADARMICDVKVSDCRSRADNCAANEWSYIRALFSDNCRADFLALLGCEPSFIQAQLAKYVGGAAAEEATTQILLPASASDSQHLAAAERVSAQWTTAEDLFGAPATALADNGFAGPSESAQMNSGHSSATPTAPNSDITATQDKTSPSANADMLHKPTFASCRVPNAADDAVLKKAILIGDFPSAVSICFQQDRLDDALILASAGGADLWQSTRAHFFARKHGGLIGAIGGIIRGDLDSLVACYPLADWQEALAMLCTYGTNENFNGLCEALGDRLALECADGISAAIAYICAQAVDKVVALWAQTATAQSPAIGRSAALQEFAERVLLFKRAVWMRSGSPPLASATESYTLSTHAATIANEGYLACAAFYAARIQDAPLDTTTPAAGHVLRDRLLRCFLYSDYAAPAAQALFQAPFPYALLNVGIAPTQHESALHDGYTTAATQIDSGRNQYSQVPGARPFSAAPLPGSSAAPGSMSHPGVAAAPAQYGQQAVPAYPSPATSSAVPHVAGMVTGTAPRPAGVTHGISAESPWSTHQPTLSQVPAATTATSAPAPAPTNVAPPEFDSALVALVNVNAWLQSLVATGKLRPEEKKIVDDAAKALETLKFKADAGRISREAFSKLILLGSACAAWDMAAAVRTGGEMASIDPKENKDWQPALRYMLNLANRKATGQ